MCYHLVLLQVLVSAVMLLHYAWPQLPNWWVFSSNDSFYPMWFLDCWRFSLEVIWGRSPLKSKLNIFLEDPAVVVAGLFKNMFIILNCVVQSVHVIS